MAHRDFRKLEKKQLGQLEGLVVAYIGIGTSWHHK
jgi:hypothetical protein